MGILQDKELYEASKNSAPDSLFAEIVWALPVVEL
jgi:hypothetical protein